MKKFGLGMITAMVVSLFVMSITTTTAALAADAIVADEVPTLDLVVAAPDHSGFYAGGMLGWADGDGDFTHKNVNNFGGPGGTYNNGGDVFVGGVFTGYNYQFQNNVVLGVEAAIRNGSKMDDGGEWAIYNNTTSSHIKYVASFVGRAGYAFGNYLPYVQAGVAGGNVSMNQTYAPPLLTPTTFDADKFLTGYTVGAGLDVKLTERVVVGVNYSFTDLGSHTFSGNDSGGKLTQINGKFQEHAVMMRLAYRF